MGGAVIGGAWIFVVLPELLILLAIGAVLGGGIVGAVFWWLL